MREIEHSPGPAISQDSILDCNALQHRDLVYRVLAHRGLAGEGHYSKKRGRADDKQSNHPGDAQFPEQSGLRQELSATRVISDHQGTWEQVAYREQAAHKSLVSRRLACSISDNLSRSRRPAGKRGEARRRSDLASRDAYTRTHDLPRVSAERDGASPAAASARWAAARFHAADSRFSRMIFGCRAAIRSRASAGPSG